MFRGPTNLREDLYKSDINEIESHLKEKSINETLFFAKGPAELKFMEALRHVKYFELYIEKEVDNKVSMFYVQSNDNDEKVKCKEFDFDMIKYEKGDLEYFNKAFSRLGEVHGLKSNSDLTGKTTLDISRVYFKMGEIAFTLSKRTRWST